MAHTLLDSAYQLHNPSVEFAALGGKKSSLLKRTGRGASQAARSVGRGAKRILKTANRNKKKLAISGAALAGAGITGAYAVNLYKNKKAEKFLQQPGMARASWIANNPRIKRKRIVSPPGMYNGVQHSYERTGWGAAAYPATHDTWMKRMESIGRKK